MRISDWSSDVCSSDLLQHQFFARLRAKGLKQIAILFGKIRPFERHGDRFHIGNPLYTLAVAAGPVEAEDGPPVMHDQNNPVPEIERLPQRVEIVTMLGIGITLGPRRIELVRIAHADQVRSEEHTSELQSLMRTPYAVFCLKKKTNTQHDMTEGQESTNLEMKTVTNSDCTKCMATHVIVIT